jgi:hypothetical protein
MLQAKAMTGYVMMERAEYEAKLEDPVGINDITVYVVDGGQQTRGIQQAMVQDSEVREFRNQPKHFPALTVYAGLEMRNEDFATVLYYSYF